MGINPRDRTTARTAVAPCRLVLGGRYRLQYLVSRVTCRRRRASRARAGAVLGRREPHGPAACRVAPPRDSLHALGGWWAASQPRPAASLPVRLIIVHSVGSDHLLEDTQVDQVTCHAKTAAGSQGCSSPRCCVCAQPLRRSPTAGTRSGICLHWTRAQRSGATPTFRLRMPIGNGWQTTTH